jgi:hypothetical protein
MFARQTSQASSSIPKRNRGKNMDKKIEDPRIFRIN